jgi:hypothetical protein
MPNEVVEIELVNTWYACHPCTVCGGYTGKHGVVAKTDGITVCEQCLEVGNIDERLEMHAQRLEAGALFLRNRVGRLRVPTFEQWQAANEYCDVAYGTDLIREQWDGWTSEQRRAWKDHGRDAWERGDPEARTLVPEIERPPMSKSDVASQASEGAASLDPASLDADAIPF